MLFYIKLLKGKLQYDYFMFNVTYYNLSFRNFYHCDYCEFYRNPGISINIFISWCDFIFRKYTLFHKPKNKFTKYTEKGSSKKNQYKTRTYKTFNHHLPHLNSRNSLIKPTLHVFQKTFACYYVEPENTYKYESTYSKII